MPQPLGHCEACNAPIYMETVEGACTCQLGALRAIQANLRIQNERRLVDIRNGVPATPPSLPAAIRATVQARGSPQSLENILMAEARRATGQPEAPTAAPLQPPSTIAQPQPVQAARSEPISSRHQAMMRNASQLEQLWADAVSEVTEPLENLWWADIEGESSPDSSMMPESVDIEFDDGLHVEFENNPTGWTDSAPRFRVDRGTPTRIPFNAAMEPGPGDGVVVGNIREPRGRPTREPMSREASIRQFRERAQQVSREDVQQVGLARPAAKPAVKPDTTYRPTVYDRLRKGFLDDD